MHRGIQCRGSGRRALATAAGLALALMAGAAQATDYNFSFSSTAATNTSTVFNGFGTITSNGPGTAITGATLTINNQSYVLNVTGAAFFGYGGSPIQNSTSVFSLFRGNGTNDLVVGTTSTSNIGFDFESGGGNDYIQAVSNGSITDLATLTGEGFTAAPGPMPGDGALSWAVAGLAALGLALRKRAAK